MGLSRSPTTPSTSMSTPRTSSRRSSSSSTAACWSPTPGVASPRSSVERVPVRGSRSPIVDRFFGHVGKRGLAWTRTAFGIALISYESRLASNDGLLRCTFMAPWEIGIRLESTWPPYDTPGGFMRGSCEIGIRFLGEDGSHGSDRPARVTARSACTRGGMLSVFLHPGGPEPCAELEAWQCLENTGIH